MADEEIDGAETGSSAARTFTLLIIGVIVIGAVLAAVSILGDGSDDDPPDEAAADATDSVTTEPPDTEPPDTDPPDTEPPNTDPPATEPPATDPPDTEPPDTEPPATEPPDTEPPATEPPASSFSFSIRGIDDGAPIPRRFTCDGTNQPPVITIEGVPNRARQLAFLTEDPDAPSRTFVHWVVYGIAPDIGEFSDGRDDVTYGLNDVQLLDWFGPCPPEGDGPHSYTFTLFALDEQLALDPGLDGRQLRNAIEPSTITEATLVATYER